MEISKLLTPDRIVVPLDADDKTSAIRGLIDVLAAAGALADKDAALAAVLKRESERSTGIGYGLAIPHGKTDGAKQVVLAAGKPKSPIDFKSVDERPVTFIVLLVSPTDQTAAHIQALAKISNLMKIAEFRDAMLTAGSPGELHAAMVRFESKDRT